MKKAGILLVLLTACLGLPAREVINLNRDWRFFSYSEGSSDRAQNVNLPHTWNNDALGGKNDYFRGVGNYMKDIQVPLEWRNKRVFIRFSGAGTVTDLIVNGRHVGEHRGGFGAFTFELTGYLRYGEQNLLWAIVNNAPRLDVLPTAGDINIYGGLYRDVDLIVTEPSHIAVNHYGSQGVYVHQKSVSRERAELEAVVRIDGLRDRLLSVTATVVTPMRDTVASEHARFRVPAEGRGSVSVPIAMDNPRLWNGTADPFMYDVIVRLMDDSLLCDEVTVPLGLRYFSVDPKQGFLLNGSPYRLRGVSHYEDRASVGNALTPYQIAEDLDLIAEMGANAVRAAAYPHNESFYDECDRRGLVVLSELPLIGPAYMTDRGYINTEAFRDNGRDQLREMIFQQFNHPSVAVWGIFFDQTPRGDDPTAYVKELNSLAMLEDPSRLTSATSNQDGKINFVTDLVVWDHNYGWKEGLPSDIKVWLDQLGQPLLGHQLRSRSVDLSSGRLALPPRLSGQLAPRALADLPARAVLSLHRRFAFPVGLVRRQHVRLRRRRAQLGRGHGRRRPGVGHLRPQVPQGRLLLLQGQLEPYRTDGMDRRETLEPPAPDDADRTRLLERRSGRAVAQRRLAGREDRHERHVRMGRRRDAARSQPAASPHERRRGRSDRLHPVAAAWPEKRRSRKLNKETETARKRSEPRKRMGPGPPVSSPSATGPTESQNRRSPVPPIHPHPLNRPSTGKYRISGKGRRSPFSGRRFRRTCPVSAKRAGRAPATRPCG